MSPPVPCPGLKTPNDLAPHATIFYINGMLNSEEQKVKDLITPLLEEICLPVLVEGTKLKVKILHNNVTPSLQSLVGQIWNGSLDDDKQKCANEKSGIIENDLGSFTNPIMIIGHSQGASLIEIVLELLSEYRDRIYVISLGGVHSIRSSEQDSDNIREFVHIADFCAFTARWYHKEKSKNSYSLVGGSCGNDGSCHDIKGYLNNPAIKKAIQDMLQNIVPYCIASKQEEEIIVSPVRASCTVL